MTNDEINAAVQSIISATRLNTEGPTEGMHCLIAACYAFWKGHKTKDARFEEWLQQTIGGLRELHKLNTPTTGIIQ